MPGPSNDAPPVKDAAIYLRRDIMHPMFIELFLEPDADDLVAEEDRRRRMRRSRRARSVKVIRPSERKGAT
jgi:hypothetical protein